MDVPPNYRSGCEISCGEGVEEKRRDSVSIYEPSSGRGDFTGVWTLRDTRHPGGWGVRETKGRVFQNKET